MDLAAASAGPWLTLGVVLGVLLAGLLGLAAIALRRPPRAPDSPAVTAPAGATGSSTGGWTEDDLPAFLEQPPGVSPDPTTASATSGTEDPPLAAPEPLAAPVAALTAAAPSPGRLLLVLGTVAVLLVGVASVLALVPAPNPSTGTAAGGSPATPLPTWEVPDLTALPERPDPGDPGAGRLSAASLPIGTDGAFARLAFEGLVLERRAVGVTVAYPRISVTAAAVPGGPALAHVRLPVWNCLSDEAPDDPVAAGCRRLPTEYAELPTPALSVGEDGEGLRIEGRFATYVRPGGSPPDWTGRVYPFSARVAPDGDGATGTLHLGTERASAVGDPRLSDFRRGR